MRCLGFGHILLCSLLIGASPARAQNGTGPLTYSGLSPLTGTLYFPVGGGALPSGDESSATIPAAFTAVVSNFFVSISNAPGLGNSIVFTWRDNAISQTLTCTIAGAVAKSCSDLSHSFTATQGDSIDIQTVAIGSIPVLRITMTTQYGSVAAVPSGAILLTLSACSTGYTEVAALNGKTLEGTLFANGNVGTTGGSDTITPAGTVAAPVFIGSSVTTSAASAGTPAGTVAAIAATATTGFSAVGAATGTLVATEPHTHPAPAFVGSVLGTHTHTNTAAGTNSAPAFSGVSFDNRSTFTRVIFCQKN